VEKVKKLKMDCVIFKFVANMWENVGMFMSGYFFSGSSVAKLDEKGRFVLPQSMRYGLVEEGKCEFVIGLGLGGCLAIYRKSVIDQIVEKFKQNQHVAKFQKFFTLFFSTLHQTECDKVGRVAIPASLKSAIGIHKEIVVAGVMDKIELWPKEVYDRNLRNLLEGHSPDMSLAKMTEEAFALLNQETPAAPVQQTAQQVPSEINPLYMGSIPAKV
jgi:MraZ protein